MTNKSWASPSMPKQIPLDFVTSEIPPGLSVIEASAGTGKTYSISHLVPRLLLDGTVKALGEVLLVTFTNDAARELSDRVRRILEKLAAPAEPDEQSSDAGICQLRARFSSAEHPAILQQALIDIDNLNVSTIHSFCQRTIQLEGTLCGLPVVPEVITKADDLIEEALYDLWQEKIARDPLLAMLANVRGWKIKEDIAFVRKALPMEEFEPVPEVQPFEEMLGRVRNAPVEFTSGICGGLFEFISSASCWNKSGGDEAARGVHLQALADAKASGNPGFWSAVEWVSALASHVAARGNPANACRAQAEALPAVRRSQEIMSLLAGLRWSWQNLCVRTVRDEVTSALHANRQITQDGLILALRDALRSRNKEALAGRLRGRYKVALIDESQDTDPKQFEIFKNTFIGFEGEPPLQTHRLVMIGDPKQAIYGFRGADVNTYLEARAHARKTFILSTTYRSPQPLVDAINAFFDRPDSLLKQGLSFYRATSGRKEDTQLFINRKPCEGRVEAWIVPEAAAADYRTSGSRRDTITATVASEIVRLLKCGALGTDAKSARRIEPRDFAVLTNSNAEAELMTAALKDRGVPAIVASGADVLGTDEAGELLCILRAVNEPRRSGLRHAALATRFLGYDSSAIQGIRSDPAKDDEALGKFLRWQVEWERKGLAATIALIDREEGGTARIAASDRGERRVTNFRQLIDLLQAASQEYSSRPGHVLRWLAQEIARSEENGAADERQIQLESDRDAVQVVTMHKAKGLEYNFVFAPFLWSLQEPKKICVLAKSPSDPKDRLVDADLAKNDTAIQIALRQSGLEDRLRLAYVAMTRAMVRLWIYGGEMGSPRSKLPASPLDWLLRDAAVEVRSPEDFLAWAESAKTPGRGGRHSAGIQSLSAKATPGLILQKAPPEKSDDQWEPDGPADVCNLTALPAPEIGGYWSITSFSSLTREKNPHGTKEPESLLPQRLGPARPSRDMERNPFISAPGGTLMGTAVHDWLQRWDCDPADLNAVREHLKKFRLRVDPKNSTAALDESVYLMLNELRGARLPGLDCSIAEACSSHEASEWHFHLPIKEALSPYRLAEAFSSHASPEYQDYAPMLEVLSSPDLKGFLQGFMDRLAFRGNAFGVIDWKTNRLGDDTGDYNSESMLACAMQSHYLLQTHLYLVALRRYLKRVVPGARLAGAWLVFLRAVSAGTSEGILHIHPGEKLLDALDALFLEGNDPEPA